MSPSDESARNQTGPPEQAAGTGRDQQEGKLTETPESLPRRVHDLIDRWLVRRRRGLRPQDIGELLGIVHYLAATLQDTRLVRLRAATHQLEHRLQLHSQALLPLKVHEQETLGVLFQSLRTNLEDDWRDQNIGQRLDEEIASQANAASRDQPGTDVRAGRTGSLVFLLDPDSAAATPIRDVLSSHGYAVRMFSDAEELDDSLSRETPDTVIADIEAWEARTGRLHGASDSEPGIRGHTRVLHLCPDLSTASRLRALRAGGDAVLPKPPRPAALLQRIAGWSRTDLRTPFRCLLVEANAARREELRTAFLKAEVQVECLSDVLLVPDTVERVQPDIVLMPLQSHSASGPEIAKVLRQSPAHASLPLLFSAGADAFAGSLAALESGRATILDHATDPGRIVRIALALARSHREESAFRMVELTRDPRTGLYHASAFEQAVQRRLDSAEGSGGIMALLHVQIDGYEKWSTECTAQSLNALLARVARCIEMQLGERDLAASLGGGAFAVFTARPNADAAMDLAEVLRDGATALNEERPVQEWNLSFSIGVCLLETRDDLIIPMSRARQLCRDARQLGGGRVHREAPVVEDASSDERREQWAGIVRSSITEKRLQLVFQPIASIASDEKTCRFEVCLRVRDHGTGPLEIREFFHMAEQVGLSRLIDRWVLQNALDALIASEVEDVQTQFFVKIGRETLLDRGFEEWLETSLGRLQPKHGSLVLQLSAPDVMAHPARVQELMEKMRSIGLPVVMEHLGIDDDSVRLLQELRPDFVKFHAAVTRALAPNTHELERLRYVVTQAQSYGVRTIAAYVEDANGLALLWQSRFDLIQGNFLRQPNPDLSHYIEI